MTSLADARAFVEALRFEDSGLVLGEKRVGRPRLVDDTQLKTELEILVYEKLYTRPYPSFETVKVDSLLDLTATLEPKNSTRPRIEVDWIVVENAPDGSVVATRHGRTRRFHSGQFLVLDGVSAVPGNHLQVFIPGGSSARQAGFYYAFSEGFRDVNDLCPIVRIYWNVSDSGAPLLLSTLTSVLNRYEIPFEFKTAINAVTYSRSDCAVLYISKDLFHVVMLALKPEFPKLSPFLSPTTPLFTKLLSDGIGLAEDPMSGESFGMARSRLVAEALIMARQGTACAFDAFVEHFNCLVAEAGLRSDALWLNSHSEDIYEIPK